jgi:thioredoxin reductase
VSQQWECAVVGAGAAGLSAALVLGRARRQVVVIDAGHQSNRASPTIGGLLGYDQRSPAELYAQGRSELEAYPSVEFRTGEVVRGSSGEDGYLLELADGENLSARRVLLATGMNYNPPDLPGIGELWGSSVFQCPFCHGWEMRDKRLAALASGEEAVHAALMLRGWSDDVMLLTDGPTQLDSEQLRMLQVAKVEVDQRRVVELASIEGRLTAVVFADGDRLERDGLLVEAPLSQRTRLAEQLGAACTPGPLAGDALDVDQIHRTNAPTVFAAGDVCTKQPHLAGAIAAGSQAAMIIVQSLLSDDFGLPYPPG